MPLTLNLYHCEKCPKNKECTEECKSVPLVNSEAPQDVRLNCKYEGMYDTFGRSLVPIDKEDLLLEFPDSVEVVTPFGKQKTVISLSKVLESLGYIKVKVAETMHLYTDEPDGFDDILEALNADFERIRRRTTSSSDINRKSERLATIIRRSMGL